MWPQLKVCCGNQGQIYRHYRYQHALVRSTDSAAGPIIAPACAIAFLAYVIASVSKSCPEHDAGAGAGAGVAGAGAGAGAAGAGAVSSRSFLLPIFAAADASGEPPSEEDELSSIAYWLRLLSSLCPALSLLLFPSAEHLQRNSVKTKKNQNSVKTYAHLMQWCRHLTLAWPSLVSSSP